MEDGRQKMEDRRWKIEDRRWKVGGSIDESCFILWRIGDSLARRVRRYSKTDGQHWV
jgi:hypothetical protein